MEHLLASGCKPFRLGLRLIVLGACFSVHAAAPQVASAQRESPSQIAEAAAFKQAVETQRDAIAKENAATPRTPWAGDFYFGDGEGANVQMSLAPRTGVAATWQGCLGIYVVNKGKVMPQADGSLVLNYERPNQERGIGFAHQVVPVPWGERMYLISEKQLAAFASAVNLGDEPRAETRGMFLMRRGDEQRKAFGLPRLPPAQQRWIHVTPVEVGVVSAKHLHNDPADHLMCRYRLELDRGDQAGLAAGMELKSIGQCAGNRIVLERTTPNRAIGTMDLYGEECTDPNRRPSNRTRFTTGAYPKTSVNSIVSADAR